MRQQLKAPDEDWMSKRFTDDEVIKSIKRVLENANVISKQDVFMIVYSKFEKRLGG